ncbi:transposase [Halalkalibacterium halodurans]|uniref:transposase n=1 Tax=Halalkalibacterium halodurans TaxID=86665 RepID=UPI002E21FCD1|nr:transposase [Halalkalibacterium halodurans]
MQEAFVKALYESIVKENLNLYKELYETTNVTSKTNEHWTQAIDLYNNLDNEDKAVLFKIIEQTMIDTISNMLGAIDGNSTLKDFEAEPKLLLDSVDTEGELQDYFLTFIEDKDEDA